MSYRITRTLLEAKLRRYLEATRRPLEPYIKDLDGNIKGNKGCIVLDHNSFYGGYILREILESTDEQNFGMNARVDAKSMAQILDILYYTTQIEKE